MFNGEMLKMMLKSYIPILNAKIKERGEMIIDLSDIKNFLDQNGVKADLIITDTQLIIKSKEN